MRLQQGARNQRDWGRARMNRESWVKAIYSTTKPKHDIRDTGRQTANNFQFIYFRVLSSSRSVWANSLYQLYLRTGVALMRCFLVLWRWLDWMSMWMTNSAPSNWFEMKTATAMIVCQSTITIDVSWQPLKRFECGNSLGASSDARHNAEVHSNKKFMARVRVWRAACRMRNDGII